MNQNKMSRYTVTMTIYMDAKNDKHAVSKAKLIAERERYNYPNQDCAVEKIHSTPFASFDIREVDINKIQKQHMGNRTVKTIGNFKVELGDEVIMIKDLKDNLLKAESVRASEGENRFEEVCEGLKKKIAERKEKGLST